MPQVPVRYKSTVNPQAAPNARLNPNTPSDAFGNGTSKVVDAVTALYDRERKKADEVAVLDADRALGEFENRALYDPKAGALNKRGKDSFGLPEQVMGEFDRISGELYNSLGNDNQKLAYRKYMESRRRDIDRTLQRHVGEEISKYDDQTTESFVANELEAAVHNYKDPERIGHAIARVENEYTRYAGRKGLPEDWTKRKIAEATSKAHAGVITRMLANGDDKTASEYYAANKEDIKTGNAPLEKALEEGSLRGESQRQTDAILAQHGAKDDRTDALAAAKAIKDPKIRDLAEERVNKYFTERQNAETERLNKMYVSATNVVDKTGDETKIDPVVWSQMSLERRSALKLYAKNKREGTEPELDHPTWVKFTYQSEEQLSKLTEAEFMEKYYPKLDKAHRDRGLEMMRLARDSAKKGGSPDPKFATTITFKDQVKMTLEGAKIIKPGEEPSKWNEETARRYTAFQDEAWRRVQQFEMTELQGKRPATHLEMQGIMDKVLMDKVFVDEWGRDTEVPALFIKEDQRGKTYVPLAQVPKDVKAEAVNLAKSLGNIPQDMPQAEAEKILARRIERAYGARLTRATRQEIIDIIRGHN